MLYNKYYSPGLCLFFRVYAIFEYIHFLDNEYTYAIHDNHQNSVTHCKPDIFV